MPGRTHFPWGEREREGKSREHEKKKTQKEPKKGHGQETDQKKTDAKETGGLQEKEQQSGGWADRWENNASRPDGQKACIRKPGAA